MEHILLEFPASALGGFTRGQLSDILQKLDNIDLRGQPRPAAIIFIKNPIRGSRLKYGLGVGPFGNR